MSVSMEQRLAALDLIARAANSLDADRMEDWAECFFEDGSYQILSRENVERGLPLPLFMAENKQMIRDRVLSLRKANVTNPHRDRHIIGPAEMRAGADGEVVSEAGFAVYSTTPEGVSRLFSLGVYKDRIQIGDAGARFVERTAIVDMFSIPTMLSTPV
ncbi:MAG TPA: aromatic-ring-hydroxylating dioxygenase subunit beta [Novosphingobium sp.]|nr:aromatic-ring-hydroxylating dioxygenase subunit beta [Novosphingobium sp.]